MFMDHSLNVRNSLEYIENNLSENISLDDIAKKACLSKYHYHRLFHKTVGESVKSYINRKRMENAAKELIETDQSIIDIALKYQYASQEAFSRAFKKTFSLTPGKYRRIARGNKTNIHYLCSCANQIHDIAA